MVKVLVLVGHREKNKQIIVGPRELVKLLEWDRDEKCTAYSGKDCK